jgi:hypothetical protein
LALLYPFENTRAQKVLSEQVLKLCELDSVLDVLHGMIPVCMEFMHVLLQRLVRTLQHVNGIFPVAGQLDGTAGFPI